MASTAARTGHRNEDFVGVVPTAAVLIDGAGMPGVELICRHGVAWYASRLGGELLGLLSLDPDRTLPALLAEAIERVADVHRVTCDLANPSSPSATVAILRRSGGRADYLVLGDSFLVLDRAGAPLVVSDPREVTISRPYRSALAALAEGSAEYEQARREGSDVMRANRNRPGGFWVARGGPPGGGRGDHRKLPHLRADRCCPAQQRSQPDRGPVPAGRLAGGLGGSRVQRTRRNHRSRPAGGGTPRSGGGRCHYRLLHRPRRVRDSGPEWPTVTGGGGNRQS
jgi:hypothetical protein